MTTDPNTKTSIFVSPNMFLSINQYIMKLKLSILTILLFFLSASFPLAAQKAPQPFDIDTPSLRVFLPAPELATGRAIVACPGGGYGGLAVNHEGYDWAPYFNKQGIALIVLKYRMPHGDRTLPISDAEAAMKWHATVPMYGI